MSRRRLWLLILAAPVAASCGEWTVSPADAGSQITDASGEDASHATPPEQCIVGWWHFSGPSGCEFLPDCQLAGAPSECSLPDCDYDKILGFVGELRHVDTTLAISATERVFSAATSVVERPYHFEAGLLYIGDGTRGRVVTCDGGELRYDGVLISLRAPDDLAQALQAAWASASWAHVPY